MKLIQSPLRYASVWLLGLAATIAGLEPFLPELAKVLPEHWYGYASVLILVARVIQQGPPKPPDGGTSGAGPLLLALLACLASGTTTGCALFRPAAPDFTSEEAKCLTEVDAREDIELVACGKDTSGGCSTDTIMDRYDAEAEACLKNF